MRQRAEFRAVMRGARAAAGALIVGLALLAAPAWDSRAADADAVSTATEALAHQTQHLANDAGQFYLVWWIPPALAQAILRDTPNAGRADALQALDPYIVFALARAQVGENGLVDLHDKADLLLHSRLTINGQVLEAVSADQNDPGAQAALALIKPALTAMLGRFNRGIEFVLYRPQSGMALPDPTLVGTINYKLYHMRFSWQLPVWATAAPAMAVAATPATAPMPMAPPATSPAPMPAPVNATATRAPVALPLPAASSPGPAAAPIPVQRRKIDPTSGEEFPERYNYNPYTGQKLVSQ